MSTHTERTNEVTQIDLILETSHADFTRAFESPLMAPFGSREVNAVAQALDQ